MFLLVFGRHKVSASHRLHFILQTVLQRCKAGSHFKLFVVLKKWAFVAKLILDKLIFSILLFFGERPRRAFVSAIKMVGIMGELSIR